MKKKRQTVTLRFFHVTNKKKAWHYFKAIFCYNRNQGQDIILIRVHFTMKKDRKKGLLFFNDEKGAKITFVFDVTTEYDKNIRHNAFSYLL